MELPVEGHGTIQTGQPLLDSVGPGDHFVCPDPLYPQSERDLQYQLYSILREQHDSTEGSPVYIEVRLGGDTEAIDLVWYDSTNRRSVGIEIKRVATVEQAREQIRRYRDYTLEDVVGKEYINVGRNRVPANDYYALDAVWLATYARPRPQYSNHVKDDSLTELVPEADGYLQFESYSGELHYNLTETPSRETLWEIGFGDTEGELTEPEAPLVAEVWHQSHNGRPISAEATFSPGPEYRAIKNTPSYQSHKQADLVISDTSLKEMDDTNHELVAIEVKSSFDHGIQQKRIAEQLQEYVDSKMFSRVYLAVPCSMVPDNFLPTSPDKAIDLGDVTPPRIKRVIEKVPEVGIISIHQNEFHSDSRFDLACDYEQLHPVEDEPYCAQLLTRQKTPYIIHCSAQDIIWEYEEDI